MTLSNRLTLLCLLVVAPLLCSCATRSSPEAFQRSYEFVLDSAERRLEAGEHGKAFVLADAIMGVDPYDERAVRIKAQAVQREPDLARLERRSGLGRNVPLRQSRRSAFPIKILLWPVNLVVDLLDVVTVEVGPGIGVGAKAQVTEPLSLGAQLSLGATYVGLQGRHPAVRAAFEQYLDLFPLEFRGIAEASFGTFGAYAAEHKGTGVKAPSDRLYQRARDYWAIGAEASAGLVNANVKIHPVQIGDWLAGIFFFDPLTDNVGTTKSIGRLDTDEKDAIRRLVRQ